LKRFFENENVVQTQSHFVEQHAAGPAKRASRIVFE